MSPRIGRAAGLCRGFRRSHDSRLEDFAELDVDLLSSNLPERFVERLVSRIDAWGCPRPACTS